MSANADQIEYWNDVVGSKWVDAQVDLDRVMAPLTEVLLEVAAPAPGEKVLDVGCGCGDLEPRLAAAIGPQGRVRGVDISRPMLARAAARLDGKNLGDAGQIEFFEADAMTQTFEADNDLIVSRFGVMFFDDRERAFTNLRSALKPGGRLTVMAWRGRDEVEWLHKPLEWIAPVLPIPEKTDGQIGPFGMADGEATRQLLEKVGFWDVRPDPIDRELEIADTVEAALRLLTNFGPAAALIREASSDDRARARTLLREGIERQAPDGRLKLRGACWAFRGVAG